MQPNTPYFIILLMSMATSQLVTDMYQFQAHSLQCSFNWYFLYFVFRLWCSNCSKSYREKNIHYRYHVNLTVSDFSGIARVTIFGKCLEAFFGLTATEFCRYVYM